jgi:hypothetical protein
MAEQNRQQQQQEEVPDHPQFRQQKKDEDEGPVTLGDGTVLKESDKPRNPKKKMWEATRICSQGSGNHRANPCDSGGAKPRNPSLRHTLPPLGPLDTCCTQCARNTASESFD